MSKIILALVFIFCPCSDFKSFSFRYIFINQESHSKRVDDITPPPGYKRIFAAEDSFAEWLRGVTLKKERLVYLYNGKLKTNQSAQFAVLDISVGKKDLQQCADAVMRLRAEYLFDKREYEKINFLDNAGNEYKWNGSDDRIKFERYLENVFGWCGTASLEKQLKRKEFTEIMPGDVLIKGGFPGHAMIIMDVIVNDIGKKLFLLAQSYMPAQDIHIVKNPLDQKLNPWYAVSHVEEIITPEYIFKKNHLRTW